MPTLWHLLVWCFHAIALLTPWHFHSQYPIEIHLRAWNDNGQGLRIDSHNRFSLHFKAWWYIRWCGKWSFVTWSRQPAMEVNPSANVRSLQVVCLLISFSIACYHKSSGSLLCVEKLNECVSHIEDEIPRSDRVPSRKLKEKEQWQQTVRGLQCSKTGAGHTSFLVPSKSNIILCTKVGEKVLRNLFRPCPLKFLNIIWENGSAVFWP